MNSSTRKNTKITWFHILTVLTVCVIIPYTTIYFTVEAIDSGYFGGKPGYVSGNSIMVWFVNRLHIVIIGAALGSFAFLGILVFKVLGSSK